MPKLVYTYDDPNTSNRTKPIKYTKDNNDCFNCFSHSKNIWGYPQLVRNGITWQMHRYIFSLEKGPIPEGMVVRHTCDNPECINPDHLIIGTVQDNNNDKLERERQARGESHGSAKLSEEIVRYIRENLDKQTSKLANLFGVAMSTISDIKSRRRWRHID